MAFVIHGSSGSGPDMPDFPKIDAAGTYPSVCAAIIDAGKFPPPQDHLDWGEKDKIRIVFQIEENQELKNVEFFCSKTLADMGSLKPAITPWLSSAPVDITLDAKDPEWLPKLRQSVMGLPVVIMVAPNKKGRLVVMQIQAPMAGLNHPTPDYAHEYIRCWTEEGNRRGATQNVANGPQPTTSAGSDEDLPF